MYEIKIIHKIRKVKVTWALSTYWPKGLKAQNTQSSFGKSIKIYREPQIHGVIPALGLVLTFQQFTLKCEQPAGKNDLL